MTIDAEMNSMPPGWKSRWCSNYVCACMGCANKSGGLSAKGYSYEDWRDWISRNKEEYMNGLSPIKEVKWNEATEKMKQNELIVKLENNNWRVLMQNASYPMLEVIDENTVKLEGVEYKKVPKEKPQTLYDALAPQMNTVGFHFNEQQRGWICDIVRGWLIGHTVIETEDAEKITFTIHKEQLQTPK